MLTNSAVFTEFYVLLVGFQLRSRLIILQWKHSEFPFSSYLFLHNALLTIKRSPEFSNLAHFVSTYIDILLTCNKLKLYLFVCSQICISEVQAWFGWVLCSDLIILKSGVSWVVLLSESSRNTSTLTQVTDLHF